MRLNRIDICSSIDFELISTGFTALFASFFLGVYVASNTGYITRYLLQQLDLGRATATVSLHVDLHNPYQCVSTTIQPLRRLSF